jgi:hypothetical protein
MYIDRSIGHTLYLSWSNRWALLVVVDKQQISYMTKRFKRKYLSRKRYARCDVITLPDGSTTNKGIIGQLRKNAYIFLQCLGPCQPCPQKDMTRHKDGDRPQLLSISCTAANAGILVSPTILPLPTTTTSGSGGDGTLPQQLVV